jgi:hypothetical protein
VRLARRAREVAVKEGTCTADVERPRRDGRKDLRIKGRDISFALKPPDP